MKYKLTLLSMFIASTTLFSQSVATDTTLKKQISKLEFMVGKWEGAGWMMHPEYGKSPFDQTENIQFKLDSTAILIEGRGTVKGKTMHDALAILTYDKEKGKYSFRSFLPNGSNAAFPAELIDNKLHWYPNENVRYIIWLNEKKQWQETGEFKKDGKWSHFFEMILGKK